MARNAEKSMAMLNKWLTIKKRVVEGVQGRRPRDVSEINDVKEAERWRAQVIREATRRISDIQNAGLGEHRIRDCNDEINRLLKEKMRWENRIVELGGPDYKLATSKIVDAFGTELAGQGGYKYFGAAKDLPGVRELFEKEIRERAPRRTRKELYQDIKPDYYGWRDEEDGELLLAEQAREAELHPQIIAEWKEKEEQAGVSAQHVEKKRRVDQPEPAQPGGDSTSSDFKAYVDLPTAADISELILRKKKETLLAKYVTESQQRTDQESKELAT